MLLRAVVINKVLRHFGCLRLQLDSKRDAAATYVNAANCYKKYSTQGTWFLIFQLILYHMSFSAEPANSLNQAVNLVLEIGQLNMAARYCKVTDQNAW